MIKQLLTFAILSLSLQSNAIMLQSNTVTLTNADGSSFQAKHIGDEYANYIKAIDGTVLYYDKSTQNYTIAAWDETNQKMISSGIVYGASSSINAGLIQNSQVAFTPVSNAIIYNIRKKSFDALNPHLSK